MKRRDAILTYFVILGALLVAWAVRAAETREGNWTLRHSKEPGKAEFGLIMREHHGTSHHESDWPLSVFAGLDVSRPGKQEVHFTVSRDAGRFECEGYLNNGEGAGLFHFFADTKFAEEMGALGFTGIDEDKQFAFRIFGVSAKFVQDLRAAGIAAEDSDHLVAFRIHGVSPEMVRFLHDAGYQPEEETLVAMRIHGATPEWIAQLRQEGYDHVALQQLIAFRIHGVSPEFIAKLASLGYKHPEPEQLVAMRIHGVTPEFIQEMKSRGMNDLSIDQLVSLRIHGIN